MVIDTYAEVYCRISYALRKPASSARLKPMDFEGSDILSVRQFNRGDIETVLRMAKQMELFASKEKTSEILKGKVLASLFYEPSTRTRLSFETAMLRFGGSVVSVVGAEFSSLSKGETLQDTGKVVENYADIIAIRHSETGSAEKIAQGASIPVINAGDGIGEHPTQALLDCYTIQKERGKLDGLTVAMIGDLKFGRTVHSLSQALAHFDATFIFVSPKELEMPEEICLRLRDKGVSFKATEDFEEALKWADVIYMTRIQQERFTDAKEYERLKGRYVLTHDLLEEKAPKAIVMHPLPRIDEIHPSVDAHHGAAYFKQLHNGVAVRMALLALVLGKKP